jgi:NADPH:quinone reductase
MPNAIRFHKSGGPEVLVLEPVPIGKPGPGEARVRHTAVGVNFVECPCADVRSRRTR